MIVYYDLADCVVLMYSVTQKESFDDVEGWANSVRSLTSKQPQIFLVANKTDIPKERVVAKKLAMRYASNKGMHFQEISALNMMSATSLLERITSLIIEKRTQKTYPAPNLVPKVETGCASCSVI